MASRAVLPFASVLILSISVIGVFSFVQLGVDQFPNVDFPAVVVTTRLPCAAPEQIETKISDQIEEAVNTISGIDALRSTSSEGVSRLSSASFSKGCATWPRKRSRPDEPPCCRSFRETVQQPLVDQASIPIRLAGHLHRGDAPKSPCARSRSTLTRSCAGSSRAPSGVGQVLVLGGRNAR